MTIAVGTSLESARLNTKSPYDFAFWASTFVVDGSPDDYYTSGSETNGLALITWAAGQVGVEVPTDYVTVLQSLTKNPLSVEKALVTRGAVVIGTSSLGVCMGLNDVIQVIDGRYFHMKTTASSWDSAGQLEGLVY